MKFLITIILFAFYSCAQKDNKSTGSADWLNGTTDKKFETVSKHLRGLDMAMVETGYRYTELYWAGQDLNWEYAKYQLDKIRLAIENGIERRPKRAQSAKAFLEQAIPAMREVLEKKDSSTFNENFIIFQKACSTCHLKEKVAFIQSTIPQQRLSPVKFNKDEILNTK